MKHMTKNYGNDKGSALALSFFDKLINGKVFI